MEFHNILRNYNFNNKPYLFPSFRYIHLKRQYFHHGFDCLPLYLPLNDRLKESKVPTTNETRAGNRPLYVIVRLTITEILKLFCLNLLIIFLFVRISLSWPSKGERIMLNFYLKCILNGDCVICNQPVNSLKDDEVLMCCNGLTRFKA